MLIHLHRRGIPGYLKPIPRKVRVLPFLWRCLRFVRAMFVSVGSLTSWSSGTLPLPQMAGSERPHEVQGHPLLGIAIRIFEVESPAAVSHGDDESWIENVAPLEPRLD